MKGFPALRKPIIPHRPMSFDRIAPHYRWLEAVLAGRSMHRSRIAFLDRVAPSRVLLPGEGHGRFLVELLTRHPQAEVTVVDASAAMLDEARAALRQNGAFERVEFIHADLIEWNAPASRFDLIATNFLFDCFTPAQIESIIARLAHAATPHAHWLVADFREPTRSPARWRAKLIVWALYRFFRFTARIPASHFTPPDPWLQHHGFTLAERRHFDWGLLQSDLWSR